MCRTLELQRVGSAESFIVGNRLTHGSPVRPHLVAEFLDRSLADIPTSFPQRIIEETEEDLNEFVRP